MKAGVSIPDGDVWFFKFEIQPKPEAAYHEVSIPDGDVWFFKWRMSFRILRSGRCFNPRWGCMVFQISLAHTSRLPIRSFQSPMGMYGFSNQHPRALGHQHLGLFQSPMGMYGFSNAAWLPRVPPLAAGFNPRWGCMVFQIIAIIGTRHNVSVSIPDGDVWFFKCYKGGTHGYDSTGVSIPDGDVWFFKSWARAATARPGLLFQSPMGMYGFSNPAVVEVIGMR